MVTATIGAIPIATRRWTVLVDLLLTASTRVTGRMMLPYGSTLRVKTSLSCYSRFIIASASISRSTNCSPEMSTTASLIVPPVNAYGFVPS